MALSQQSPLQVVLKLELTGSEFIMCFRRGNGRSPEGPEGQDSPMTSEWAWGGITHMTSVQ